MLGSLLSFLLGLLLCAAAGCRRLAQWVSDPAPLRVEYAGCANVTFPGPVCSLTENGRKLALWVDLPASSEVSIESGGRFWRRASPATPGGHRFSVRIPAGSSSLAVYARPAGRAAVWRLQLAELRWDPILVKAGKLRDRKEGSSRARRLIEASLPRLPPAQHAFALSLLARIQMELEDEAAAGHTLALAIPEHRAAGRVLDVADDSRILAWLRIQEGNFAAARRTLSAVELPAGSPAEAVAQMSFSRGLLALRSGDVRTALAELKAAEEQSLRIGLTGVWFGAAQVVALQLQSLGRSREAAARFELLGRASKAVRPCARADSLVNQAWSLLLAGEAGERRADPLPPLLLAEEIGRRESCPRFEERRLNFALNRTLAHLQTGETAAGRARLDEARPLFATAPPRERMWAVELGARLDLAAGDAAAALRGYRQLDRIAVEASSLEGQWRAAYGVAQGEAALRHLPEALAACRRTEELLELRSLQIPIHEGRSTFAAQQGRATQLYLELLLGAGLDSEALAVARRARSRFLRDLARGDRLAQLGTVEQANWDRALGEYWRRRGEIDGGAEADRLLPADERRAKEAARAKSLAAAQSALDSAFGVLGRVGGGASLPLLRPGELLLAYHPLARGWAGFASDGETVETSRFELTPAHFERPAELAALLLEPFRAQLESERTKRIRILPFGPLRAVDFHSLPFGGEGHILLERFPIAYGLDLTVPPGPPPNLDSRRALLVSNPTRFTSDLPGAELEARRVTESLRALRPAWTVEPLAAERATAGSLRQALPRAVLFHYAGHGSFAGFDGWESELPLASGTRLALGDLLALGRVPPWVVLSGCDAGKSGTEAPGEGLNLAHAFILGGAKTVIAATRPVEDGAASALFSRLYGGLDRVPDLASLLREAQLAAWRGGAGAQASPGDWAAFRAFEP